MVVADALARFTFRTSFSLFNSVGQSTAVSRIVWDKNIVAEEGAEGKVRYNNAEWIAAVRGEHALAVFESQPTAGLGRSERGSRGLGEGGAA